MHPRRRALWLSASMAVGVLASCGSPEPSRTEPASATNVLTIDASALPAGEIIDLNAAASAGGQRLEPVAADEARPVQLVEVCDVDVLVIDSDRGRERVRVFGMVGRDPRWPAELDAWIATEGRARLEAWLREPGTDLFELPPDWASAGWPSALIDTDLEGLRVCRLERRGPDGSNDVRNHAVEHGWAVGSTAWTDTLALAPALPLQESSGTGGLRQLPATSALLARYRAAARDFDELEPDELQALVTQAVAWVTNQLDWQPAAPVVVRAVTRAEAAPLFEAFHTEMNERKRVWARAELERLSERNRARGQEPPESVRITLYEPKVRSAQMIEELDGFSPSGPTLYLVAKGETAGLVAEHILVHEVLHEYQEQLVDRHGLFPAPGIFGALLEPHAEWHAQRIMRARHPELGPNVAIAYFVPLRLFSRLLDELDVGADEALQRFYDDRWDAYVFADVLEGTLSLQEYLFHEHERSGFAGLDFRIGDEWAHEAVVIVSNTTAEVVDAQLHGIWLLDLSPDRGKFATVRTPPANVRLPPGAELRLRLSPKPILPDERTVRATGLFSPTPSRSNH